MFSLIFGFILHILFEAPSVNLCKLIFSPQTGLKSANNQSNNNNNEEKQKLNESKPQKTD